MSEEVGEFFGGKVRVGAGAALATALATSAQDGSRGSGESDYLNFSGKKGVYTIGQDSRKIGPDELWVVNIMSFEDGYIAWKASRPVGTRLANIFTGTRVAEPNADEGGPFDHSGGEGWHKAKAMTLKSLDNGQQGYFKINSKSGVSAFADLQDEIAERGGAGMPCWPIIRLSDEEFTAQGFKNSKPEFINYGWLSDETVVKLAGEGFNVDELIAETNGETAEKPEKKSKKDKKEKRKRATL